MTFNLPGLPSDRDGIHELADFVEFECFKLNTVSKQEIRNTLGIAEEHDYSDGVEIEDPLEDIITDVFVELEIRLKHIGEEKYPFLFKNNGHTLKLKEKPDHFFYLYKYMLLATRLNMKTSRRHSDIDGTLLFEEISESIAANYLGERSKSFVFGTANMKQSTFENKVNTLCKKLNEGLKFHNKDEREPRHFKDDGLDIVAWIPFQDRFPGQLIVFGQCKTGTHWREQLNSLQPDAFCHMWLNQTPLIMPLRFYFITESILRNEWNRIGYNAGVCFDRRRIMDYSNKFSEELENKIKTWVDAAFDSVVEEKSDE